MRTPNAKNSAFTSHSRGVGGGAARGSAFLEFVFVAIPIIFVLISIFELSRGLWIYNSLSHGVKEATRFAVVHGNNCGLAPSNCTVSAGRICQVILDKGPGLVPGKVVDVRLQTTGRTLGPYATLAACTAVNTPFPSLGPDTDDIGGSTEAVVTVTARYQFDSALAFFWPGSRGRTFGRLYLAASSQEPIKF